MRRPLGTALTGRRGGGTFRPGDPIEIHVEKIDRTESKVELRNVEARWNGLLAAYEALGVS